MKRPSVVSPSAELSPSVELRSKMATTEQHIEACRQQENDALAQCNTLQAQLDELLRTADPVHLGAIAKATSKLRAELHEAQNGLANARAISERLEADAATLRLELQDADTIEERKQAAQVVADLVGHAVHVERAAADLIAALTHLRNEGAKARVLVEGAAHALGLSPMVLEDWRQIVFTRAGGTGPEVGAAVAAILYAVAEVSGAQLGGHVAFNEFNRGAGTLASALTAGAEYVANRLGVQP